MFKLLRYMKGYTKECFLGPLFKLLEASFELMIPLVVAGIVDQGILQNDQPHIIRMCIWMFLLGVVGFICALVAQFFAAKASVGFCARIRHALMEKMLGLQYNQIDRLGTSTMITRMTADINQIQNGVNLTLRLLLRSPFVVFGAMIMAFTIDVQSALIFACLIPLLCIVVFGIMLSTIPIYKKVRNKLDDVTAATRENLSGVRVIRAFCREEEECQDFTEKTGALYHGQVFAGKISSLMNPVTFVMVNIAVVILMQVGAIKVDGGILSQGMVVALYNYMSQILVELIKMANLIITMTKAVACGNRVQSILQEETHKDHSEEKTPLKGEIQFQDVSFCYDGAAEPSLTNISFHAMPGQTIGIIGGTGSGKTTLVNLIPRLYDCSSGTIYLDGTDAANFSREILCTQIGVVPQKSVLFRGTIRENLLWGKADADDASLKQALECAQALDFVMSKEDGLDAKVEQGGSNFSGGQRQRLAIARALVREPKILILDDSASALDYATDSNLRKSIRSMKNPPTTIIVSQRAASVRFADLILVLDDGQMVGKGTHEELLSSCPVYQEIYYSQFPREVKENG